ncbi:type II secretion system F family protein [Nocardioides sp. Kera G14]|uniref:type II secretion system F family protein n=1 Tax=Nocardioides sp. Kera G14 TaxID=2884264 RepID=UPI001D12B27A|nr:type II secretion system F family protein [Nocardioides sp. Kera G14]UDY23076.1 type II secretion system F family protein [Nocardioides sp. Kera G14]
MSTLEFSYEAVTTKGGSAIKGTMEAPSSSAVAHKLRNQGLIPLRVAPVSRTGLNMEIKIPGLQRGVKTKSLAVFARQLSTLLDAGLPLLRALSVVTEQTEDERLKETLTTVHADVEGGASFSAALARHTRVFPPLMINMVRVSEMGGFLARSMRSIADTFAGEVELRQKVRGAMTYPVVVACVAAVAVIVMMLFVVPVFERMFDSMGAALPLPTRMLIAVSHSMVWVLPLLIVAAVGGGIWWARHRYDDAVRRRIDPLKLRLPVFGSLNQKIAISRFARNLSMMLSAGVPMLQALAVVGQAANNTVVAAAVEDVRSSMSRGRSFSAPLASHPVFPSMVAQMAAVGEESGSLGQMMDSIGDFYDKEVETAADQLSASIEPLMIVVLGVVIGGMVIALYLPMFSLYANLQKS